MVMAHNKWHDRHAPHKHRNRPHFKSHYLVDVSALQRYRHHDRRLLLASSNIAALNIAMVGADRALEGKFVFSCLSPSLTDEKVVASYH